MRYSFQWYRRTACERSRRVAAPALRPPALQPRRLWAAARSTSGGAGEAGASVGGEEGVARGSRCLLVVEYIRSDAERQVERKQDHEHAHVPHQRAVRLDARRAVHHHAEPQDAMCEHDHHSRAGGIAYGFVKRHRPLPLRGEEQVDHRQARAHRRRVHEAEVVPAHLRGVVVLVVVRHVGWRVESRDHAQPVLLALPHGEHQAAAHDERR
mmetsp:Transcript_3517/g.14260  ORF Transcript_3517/g.14260 Transcript_3517/m.14260 type:complete len:211 (-) Transcript_3517:781-1413(-)